MRLKNKLSLWFSLLSSGAVVLSLITGISYFQYKERIETVSQKTNELRFHILQQKNIVSNFLTFETVNAQFFETGQSDILDEKRTVDESIQGSLHYLIQNCRDTENLCAHLLTLENEIAQQDSLFQILVKTIWHRGYKDYGTVGEMRSFAHQLEAHPEVDKSLLLNLRRREKDYIIRHEIQYLNHFNTLVTIVSLQIQKTIANTALQTQLLSILTHYSESFQSLVTMDSKSGLHDNSGLKGEMVALGQNTENQLIAILNIISKKRARSSMSLQIKYLVYFIILLLLCLCIGTILARQITKPLSKLVHLMENISLTGFSKLPTIQEQRSSHEMNILYRSFNQLLNELSIHEEDRNLLIKKLVESEEKYRTMSDKLPQSVFETSRKGQIKYTNTSWKNSFGYTDNDVTNGLNLMNTIIRRKKKATLSQDVRNNEVVALRKDGSWFPALLYTDPIVENNVKKGIRGVIIDISERYNYIKLLKTERKNALAADELKSAFLANISHEVRTPLNAIMGFTTILKTEIKPTHEVNTCFQLIESNSRQLLHLFDDILEFSRIKSNQLLLHQSNLKIASLSSYLKDLIESYNRTLNRPSLRYNFIFPDSNFEVETDESRLQTILRHLLHNAVKFTEEGEIRVNVQTNNARLIFSVSDTGIGIPEHQQAIIFEPFRQADSSLTRSFEGTGIGLALCKGLVTMMGGQIWVKSKPGEGSTFFFSLPYSNNALNDSCRQPVTEYHLVSSV